MPPTLSELLRDRVALRRALAEAVIESSTAWVPDDVVSRVAEEPAHFYLRLHANRLTWFSPHATASWVLEEAQRHAFVDRMMATLQATLQAGTSDMGVDTAVGRYVTTVNLIAYLPHRSEGLPSRASLFINHYDHGRCRMMAWLELVELIEGLIRGRAHAEDHAHLAFLRENFRGA